MELGFFMTKFLSVLLVTLYMLVAVSGGVAENTWWYEQFGLSQQGIGAGKLWQFVSYGVLHGNLYHLTVNVVLLWLLGGRLEQMIGAKKSLAVVLLGVICGGVFQFGVSCMVDADGSSLLVGVSGGLMTLLLCLTTIDPYRVMRPLRIRAKHLGLGFLISELILTLIDPALGIPGASWLGGQLARAIGDSLFSVAHACHFGGGIAGLISAKVILSRSDTSGVRVV